MLGVAFVQAGEHPSDGKLVVTAENDGTACTWNGSTGALVRKFTEPQGVSGGVAGGRDRRLGDALGGVQPQRQAGPHGK
jgi:hypothetical protein